MLKINNSLSTKYVYVVEVDHPDERYTDSVHSTKESAFKRAEHILRSMYDISEGETEKWTPYGHITIEKSSQGLICDETWISIMCRKLY